VAIMPEAEGARATLLGLQAVASLLPSATLSALHIEVDPKHLIADDEEIVLQMLRESREGTSADRAARVRKAFDDWSGSAGAIGERTAWRKLVGAEERTAIQAPRDADLVIIARPRNMDGRDALHGILFSHHLVLVVPSNWTEMPKQFCRRVAVGWKPVKQVEQAMLLGLPFLRDADRVFLLAVDQADDTYSHDYVLRIVQQMGVASEIHRLQSAGRSVGSTLIEGARNLGADALLVGAYRHGQLIEQIFGGVTRDVLEAGSDLPIFMAH
jgi:nucleotide-binding universal stress UspA family protein